jgi:two-component system, chemotaxis family, protein-glutamate methylesterase/glutaminase
MDVDSRGTLDALMTDRAPAKLMIVDDSPYNRRLIEELFRNRSDIVVVASAADGEEALRLATATEPDIITLDLEMDKMDGFTFLRIMLARRSIPIIVVSSYAQQGNVLRALELGAFDFVTKEQSQIEGEAKELKSQILEKVLAAVESRRGIARPGTSTRNSLPQGLQSSGRLSASPASNLSPASNGAPVSMNYAQPKHLVAFGCSTGGPAALLELFSKIPAATTSAYLIAQHMPEKFTRAFADRLRRLNRVPAAEAVHAEAIQRGHAYVCPGAQCMDVVFRAGGYGLAVGSPGPEDRHAPSVNRLFTSLARVAMKRAVAVVLTGMGNDGVEGAKVVRAVGGIVVCESAETAVVNAMPQAVIDAGLATHTLALPAIAEFLAALA